MTHTIGLELSAVDFYVELPTAGFDTKILDTFGKNLESQRH